MLAVLLTVEKLFEIGGSDIECSALYMPESTGVIGVVEGETRFSWKVILMLKMIRLVYWFKNQLSSVILWNIQFI